MSVNASASLIFTCPDQPSAVGDLVNFFTKRKLKISSCYEFISCDQIFFRLEWLRDSSWSNEDAFNQEFQPLVAQLSADYSVLFNDRIQTIGLFVSEETQVLIELLNKFEANYFPNTEISFISGNHQAIHKIADRYAIPFFYLSDDQEPLEYERQQLDIVKRYNPNYLGLVLYRHVLSANFLNKVDCPILTSQHTFLSKSSVTNSVQQAFERGEKLIGASSYFVTAELDQGPIIVQDVQNLAPTITDKDIIRTISSEIVLDVFTQALIKVVQHKVLVYKNRTIIFD